MKIIKIADKRKYLKNMGIDEKIINYAISLSPKYSVWLAREFNKAKDPQLSMLSGMYSEQGTSLEERYPPEKMKRIIQWAETTKPDLMKYSLGNAIEKSENWYEKQKTKSQEKEKIQQRDIIYNLPQGYVIAQLNHDDPLVKDIEYIMPPGGYVESVNPEEFKDDSDINFIDGVKIGKSNIFALVDKNNNAKATILMDLRPDISKTKQKKETREVLDIRPTNEAIHVPPEEKALIKIWLDFVKKKYNVIPSIDEFYTNAISLEELNDIDDYSDYGIPADLYGIGGDAETYLKNIEEAENESWSRGYFLTNNAQKLIDNLIEYSNKRNQLEILEEAYQSYEEKTFDRWVEYEDQNYEHFENKQPDVFNFFIPYFVYLFFEVFALSKFLQKV